MLWGVEFTEKFELTLQGVIDFLTKVLKDIFGFIADEEGWTEEEVTD